MSMEFDNGVKIDFRQFDDMQLLAAQAELRAAGVERGLWAPEGAGAIAVAQMADLRKGLLANVETDVRYTNRVFEIINQGRQKRDHLPITPAEEYRERLDDQLTDTAMRAIAQLSRGSKDDPFFYGKEERPLMIIPPLPRPVSTEEVVAAIVKSSGHGSLERREDDHHHVSSILQDMLTECLEQCNPDDLSGYNEDAAQKGALTVVETRYESFTGNLGEQRKRLQDIQKMHPQIVVAPIFTTASLAQRFDGSEGIRWIDTKTAAIDVPVWNGRRPAVITAEAASTGHNCIRVDTSTGHSFVATFRQQVKLCTQFPADALSV